MLADLRYAVKWLLRSPGFAAAAIASLTIGIGFNTVLFSMVDALLFRPLPVERPDRLLSVYTRGGDGDKYATSSYPDYLDFRARNQVFTDLIGFSPAIAAIKTGDRSRMALGEVVSGNYFQALGVSAAIGRTLLPDDDRPGAPCVAAVSARLWRRDYGGEPSVAGRSITIHGQPCVIVGVLRPEFSGMVPMLQPEIWLPIASVEYVEPAGIQDAVPSPGNSRIERRGQRWLFLKGRLKDGETAARAEANLQLIMSQLAAAYPKTNADRPIATALNVRVHPVADARLRIVAIGLFVAVGLVLLIACANVANMLLARGSARRKEIGIRLAIGATRGRLVRLLLVESVLLALLGAGSSVVLAGWALRLVEALPLPIPVPLSLNLGIDARVVLFTTGAALLAGVAAGMAPALRATRVDLVAHMKGDGTADEKRQGWSLRDALVIGQTAITLVVLIAAGLLTRSILRAQTIDLGFRQQGVAIVSAELSLVGYDEQRASAVYEEVRDRVRAMPGVAAVARAVRQPLAINYNSNTIFFPDRPNPDGRGTGVAATWVDDAYFDALGVPLLRGRNFNAGDGPKAQPVAIVNEAFARRFWPGQDAIGHRFRTRGADGPEFTVVGVAADYKVQSVGEDATPYIHYALAQRHFTGNVFIARTSADPAALVGAIRREILAREPNAIFFEAQTMAAQVDAALLPARLAAQTLGSVAMVATLLASIGLYGVIAYSVGRRTREIGIRMAVGATPSGVIRLVLGHGLAIVGIGILAGLALSYGAARAIASSLYGVAALDPAAWASAVGVMLIAAALANYLPARRAARIDPSRALRSS